MGGGTKLEAGPGAGTRLVETPVLVPPQSHQPHEPPDARTDAGTDARTDAVTFTGVNIPPPASPPGRTRRLFLRAVFALGMIGGTAAALTPILRADPRTPGSPGADAAGPPAAELFDEMYGGRHIQGTDAGVRIDGRPLHMMRRADGSYVSVVNHFESFPTALATARAAVDDLGASRLALAGPTFH
ncbi:tyrosinase family oxidase copper chaperone [Streptomyces sp. NPDC051217]|uniref:tyrosinase family oxidase copper chaperone n=1 Tax=Streptomyces sp. NPDC051217 TaxID=3365644 RepID=UPI0037A0330A